jgi:aryl-alcohol dehydrogenase-like predicted oxidoreductase
MGMKTHSGSKLNPLGLGCWTFGGAQWGGQDDMDSMHAMETAFDLGINHFDTATGYGGGHSEQLLGRFIKGKREKLFIASKQSASSDKQKYLGSIEKSLRRLNTDYIDLYYIHWPKSGIDMRPTMDALMKAKSDGKVSAIGVSNFSVRQMKDISDAGKIDAHQLCYNLLWRRDEKDIIPFCRDQNISIITYSSIAQGILTGKFPREPQFREGDQRPKTVLFDDNVWPRVFEGVEEMKQHAAESDTPLTHLAIRWVLSRPFVDAALVGARNADQVAANAAALEAGIDDDMLQAIGRISDGIIRHIPDTGNIFRHYT